jgi:hypothetical protein
MLERQRLISQQLYKEDGYADSINDRETQFMQSNANLAKLYKKLESEVQPAQDPYMDEQWQWQTLNNQRKPFSQGVVSNQDW